MNVLYSFGYGSGEVGDKDRIWTLVLKDHLDPDYIIYLFIGSGLKSQNPDVDFLQDIIICVQQTKDHNKN